MKKTLLLKTMLLLCAIIFGTSAWAETKTVTISYTDIPDGYTATTGTSGSFSKTVAASDDLTLQYVGINTKSSATAADHGYGYAMFLKNYGYIYSSTAPDGYYPSKVTVTFGSNTGTSGKAGITFGESAITTRNSSVTGAVAKSGTCVLTNTDESKLFWNFSTTGANVQVDNIVVEYTSTSGGGEQPATVAAPSFDPTGGNFTTAQTVTITCSTEGAAIYYTTDGSTPTQESELYQSPISVTVSGTKIKAKAFKAEYEPSSVSSATYYIKPNLPTVSAVGATITITGDDGCSLYYTTDNSEPTNESTPYTAPFNLTESCTIKAIAYDAYGNTSNVKSFSFKYFPLNPKNINSNYYEKVTDVSTLENGDAILIVYEDGALAMGAQNNNNRKAEDVTITNNTITKPGDDVQKIVLVKQTEEIDNVDTDVFYFYVGNGYLYASSNSSNQLKTEDNPDNNNNARATISISGGDATILFTGKNARNWIKYNGTGTSSLFSCYAGTDTQMEIVQIYKEVIPTVSVTIPAGKEWITFCSTENLDFTSDIAGLEGAYTITAHENQATALTATKMTGKVKAGTGLLLRAAAVDATNPQVIAIPVAATGEEQADNMLKGVIVDTEVQPTEGTNTNLGLSNGEFHPYSAAGTLAAGKAYLQIPTAQMPTGGNNARLYIVLDGEATGINAIENSELRIENLDAPMYNLAGQRVTKSYKGVVIVNGKKYINK